MRPDAQHDDDSGTLDFHTPRTTTLTVLKKEKMAIFRHATKYFVKFTRDLLESIYQRILWFLRDLLYVRAS